MVEVSVELLDRGTVRTDVNHVLEGFVTGTADEPNPDVLMGDGPVYNLVVDHPEATILWDTGSHPEAGDGYWPDDLYAAFEHADAADHPLDLELTDAGYAIDDVDAVVQTHLHLDHAGGLRHFEGTDVPVYVHEAELKYAYYSAVTDEGDDAYLRSDFDRELNWRVVHRERIAPWTDVELLHLPGHTPGLLGLLFHRDDSPTVLLAGDQYYTRRNYANDRPMGGELLWSKRHWLESHRWVQDLERRHDAKIVCGHDPDDAEWLSGMHP